MVCGQNRRQQETTTVLNHHPAEGSIYIPAREANGFVNRFLFLENMAVTRQQKEGALTKLEGIFKNAATAVFVNFHGLTVQDVSEVRKTLKGDGVGYTVAKKTLIRKAAPQSGAEGDMPSLDGEVAVAHVAGGDDADVTAPARGIHAFVKKFENRIAILGGIFGGKFMNREEMLEIATIPSVNVLRGMFVNVINAPIQGLVVALGQIAGKKEE